MTTKREYKRNKPLMKMKDLKPLFDNTGKSCYQLAKDFDVSPVFLFQIKNTPKDKLNPSFATMTLLVKILNLKSLNDLVEKD